MTSRMSWKLRSSLMGSPKGVLAKTLAVPLRTRSMFSLREAQSSLSSLALFSPAVLTTSRQQPMGSLRIVSRSLSRTLLFFSTSSSWGSDSDDDTSSSPPQSSTPLTLQHDGGPPCSRNNKCCMKPQEEEMPRATFCCVKAPKHQRVWFARDTKRKSVECDDDNNNTTPPPPPPSTNKSYLYWKERVVDRYASTQELLALELQIEAQETSGGRLRKRQLGVLHEDPATDMQLLTDNYTVKAVASALRDREDALQYAAVLAAEGDYQTLVQHLRVFHPQYVLERRASKTSTNITQSLHRGNIEVIRKALMRMPRTVTTAHDKRAAVVIALCTVNQVPCVLLEKRARHLSSHPNEVCLPGGMVCDVQDQSIVNTCLREMKEEIGGLLNEDENPDVLGVFRCNWGEIHHLVNVAVTPVVCFLGELPEHLTPSEDEVAQVFTVPLDCLIDKSLWIHREGLAPIFVGAHEVIWGLTGYILERFAKDILIPNSRPTTLPPLSSGIEHVMPTEIDEGEVLQ